MDPRFNEAFADQFGVSEYRYCLMERNGKYQWRWLVSPPIRGDDVGLSPVFDTQAQAVEWAAKRNTPVQKECGAWKPVTP